MDSGTIILVAILSLVIVAAMLVFRQRIEVSIGRLFGLRATNEPPSRDPGVTVEDAQSRSGGLLAEDQTGRGAAVRRVNVQDDILVSSSPAEEDDEAPKG